MHVTAGRGRDNVEGRAVRVGSQGLVGEMRRPGWVSPETALLCKRLVTASGAAEQRRHTRSAVLPASPAGGRLVQQATLSTLMSVRLVTACMPVWSRMVGCIDCRDRERRF